MTWRTKDRTWLARELLAGRARLTRPCVDADRYIIIAHTRDGSRRTLIADILGDACQPGGAAAADASLRTALAAHIRAARAA